MGWDCWKWSGGLLAVSLYLLSDQTPGRCPTRHQPWVHVFYSLEKREKRSSSFCFHWNNPGKDSERSDLGCMPTRDTRFLRKELPFWASPSRLVCIDCFLCARNMHMKLLNLLRSFKIRIMVTRHVFRDTPSCSEGQWELGLEEKRGAPCPQWKWKAQPPPLAEYFLLSTWTNRNKSELQKPSPSPPPLSQASFPTRVNSG